MFIKRGELLLLLTLILIFTASASGNQIHQTTAQSTKLVSMPDFGDVDYYQISPDNQYVVYVADQETDTVEELYSLRLPNGTPVKLTSLLYPESRLSNFAISPDSSRVIYLSRTEEDSDYELHSVPISGPASESVKLSKSSINGTINFSEYQISPDSNYVVFIADQVIDGDFELFRVPIIGPATSAVELSNEPDVMKFDISPDGEKIVFMAGSLDYQDILYSVSLMSDSQDTEIISHPLRITLFVCVPTNDETRDSVHDFVISPDSSRVVYRASFVDDEPPEGCYDEVNELYSVPISGPQDQADKIHAAPYYFYDVQYYAVSSNSEQVVFTTYYQKTNELHSVPILGGSSVKLNPNLVSDGDVFDFRISPDANRVVYVADQDTNNTYELYSVPIIGPSADSTKISQSMSNGAEVDEWNFEITPDSSRVVFVAGEAYVDWNVFSVPIAGPNSQVVQISGPMTPGGFVYDFGERFTISADGTQVLYRADQDTPGISELYMAPVEGPLGSSIKINGSMNPDGDISDSYSEPSYNFCPDRKCILYVADQDMDGIDELYGYFEGDGVMLETYLPLIVR